MERNFHKIENREDFQNGSVSLKRGNDFQNGNYLSKKVSKFQNRSYENNFKARLEKEISLKNAKSKFLIILAILLLISIICSSKADATYQSRPGFSALVSTTASDFFINIRKMETSEGPMGLNADLDSNYNDTTGNGIDVHMIKNSEWGAVAMLAMSGYGGGATDAIDTYTTGSSNYTGVYAMGNGNWEYTMTFATTDGTTVTSSNSHQNKLAGINSKYYDLYYVTTAMSLSDNTSFYNYNYSGAGGDIKINHNGDAIYEMYSILKATKGTSAYTYNTAVGSPFFSRGYSDNGGVLASDDVSGRAHDYYTSRAVVVCGPGL